MPNVPVLTGCALCSVMYEWQASKAPGGDNRRKQIYLGESSSCDVGYLGYDPNHARLKPFIMWYDEDSETITVLSDA